MLVRTAVPTDTGRNAYSTAAAELTLQVAVEGRQLLTGS